MAIAYESAAAAASATCSVPSGTASGDLLVGVLVEDAGGAITPPAGWTELRDVQTFATSQRFWAGYIIVSGTPPSNYTWTGAGSTVRTQMQRFSGVASYGGSAFQDNGNTTTNVAPTVTTDADNSLVVWAGGGLATSTPATPSGFSNAVSDFASGRTDYLLCSRILASAGATGTASSTGWLAFDPAVHQHAGHMWFRPSGGGGGSALPVFMSHYRQQGIA